MKQVGMRVDWFVLREDGGSRWRMRVDRLHSDRK